MQRNEQIKQQNEQFRKEMREQLRKLDTHFNKLNELLNATINEQFDKLSKQLI